MIRLQLDPDDVIADEVAVVTVCAPPEMLAHGGHDVRLDLGRRHPANGAGTLGLPLQDS